MATTLLGSVSEAQALNLSARPNSDSSLLLSIWMHTQKPLDDLYAVLWAHHGLIAQMVAARQQTLLANATPELIELYEQYQTVRRTIARGIFAPCATSLQEQAVRREQLAGATEKKETIERLLAAQLPEFARQFEAQRRPTHRPDSAALGRCGARPSASLPLHGTRSHKTRKSGTPIYGELRGIPPLVE